MESPQGSKKFHSPRSSAMPVEKKGHYKGSRECPRTPTSTYLHAIGTDTEAEDQTSSEDMEEPADTFEGEEYPGEDDFRPAEEPELNNVGTGVIITSIHVDEDQDNDDTIVYVAATATQRIPNSNDDTKVTVELVKSIRGVASSHNLPTRQTSRSRPIPTRIGP